MNVRELTLNGLWRNNPDFVHLLGLCPLLIASESFSTGLSLGLATLLVLTVSSPLLVIFRQRTQSVFHLPATVLLTAALAMCITWEIQAHEVKLYQPIGFFIPVIVTNCLLPTAAKPTPLAAMLAGLITGSGFTLLLVVVGTLRGLLGPDGVLATDTPFLLTTLPPGAFLVTGLLIALKNVISQRLTPPKVIDSASVVDSSKRARVTGKI